MALSVFYTESSKILMPFNIQFNIFYLNFIYSKEYIYSNTCSLPASYAGSVGIVNDYIIKIKITFPLRHFQKSKKL
jgi:hypothetical protein